MKTFKEFFSERYYNISPNRSKHLDKVAEDLEKMKGPLIKRAFKTKKNNLDIILASAMKDTTGEWFGLDFDFMKTEKKDLYDIAKGFIHDKLGIKFPVFCTNSDNNEMVNSGTFGDVYILIPRGPVKYFYSKRVDDLMLYTDRRIFDIKMDNDMNPERVFIKKDSPLYKEIISELFSLYKKSTNPPSEECSEIILDTKEYWLIPVEWLEEIYSRYQINNINTYEDLINLLSSGEEG